MLTAFDPLLIALAFLVMSAGLARRWAMWRQGLKERRLGDWIGLLRYLFSHRKILERPYIGVAHLMVFFGFLIPILIIVCAQCPFTLPASLARLLSLLTDVSGAAMLAGTVFLLVRRVMTTESNVPKRTLLPLSMLVLILVMGFLAEGSRLSIMKTTFSWASPLGYLVSMALPGSPLLMQLIIRAHFLAVLLFIGMVPFTFMRHLAAAPLNVYYRKKGDRGQLRQISLAGGPLGASTVGDFTWKQLLDAEACVSCGRCEEHCPASVSGKPLSPRKIMQDILGHMEQWNRNGIMTPTGTSPLLEHTVTGDEIWSCTTCMACVEHCPVYAEPSDKIIDLRRYQVMGKGALPLEARPVVRNLEIYGDVQGKGPSYRMDWAFNRNVPLITDRSNPEVLLWVGCSGAFHPRYQEVARATVTILKAGKVPFGILPEGELCCGDPARRLGEEGVFLELAHKNIDRFRKYHIQRIVTLCPHCYNAFRNEYPGMGAEFEVLHAAQYVMGLIDGGRIFPRYPIRKKVTLHDPCYLGRINNVYTPLRGIIKSIPEIELKELGKNLANGFCCGGGGGRMWLHETMGRRINQIRAEEICKAGVDMVGTACPYCLTMLDDGLKSIEMEKPIKVLDLMEIVASSIGWPFVSGP